MKYIECPLAYSGEGKKLFLAGGITSVPDWQKDFAYSLSDTDLVICNPRREHFDMERIRKAEQIRWEHEHLMRADAVSFWFPPETLCPSTLFELGKMAMTQKKIFVGCHPEYQRKGDVVEQLALIRPEVRVVYSLDSLREQIGVWCKRC